MVARVALREVNRAIDERILPEGLYSLDGGRRVAVSACPLIAFYVESARRLTSEERQFAINEMGARLRRPGLEGSVGEDWTVRDAFLTIDLAPFVRRTQERMARLAAARGLVVCDPDTRAGAPVIAGTRVPVYDVSASVAAGLPIERILAAYPALDRDGIELAALYAEANPPRGRPRSLEDAKRLRIVSERRAPRRRQA